MAEEQQAAALSTTFPDPPPFYQHFTTANLARLDEARSSPESKDVESGEGDSSNATSAQRLRELDLPQELRYLVPPPPPEDGKYRAFGDRYDIHEPLPSLAAQGLEQLYDSTPPPSTPSAPTTASSTSALTSSRATTLKLLARSILLNYLELVGLLALDPEQYGSKIDHLSTIFLNAHHLINEYRPHQARETLILTMEEQVERKRAEVEGVRRMKEKVERVLDGLGRSDGVDGGMVGFGAGDAVSLQNGGTGKEGRMESSARDIWDALESEVGLGR